MTDSLFRKKALEHIKDNVHGDIIVIPPLSHTFIILFIVIWLGFLLFWLFNSHFARKETVNGWLEPASGVVKVYAQVNTGEIKQVLVNEGDKVTKGQPLIVINGGVTLADGSYLEEGLLNEYKAQKSLLEQQLQRAEVTFGMNKVDIIQQIKASKEDISFISNQLSIISQRYTLLNKKFEKYKKIQADGHIAVDETNTILEQKLIISSEEQSLKRAKTAQINTLQQLEARQKLLPQEYQNVLAQLKSRLSEISQNIVQLQGQQAYIIKAPRTGVINGLQAKLGQQTRTNLPLLTIVPEEESIVANLLVPVRAAGFIEVGQPLDIRYHAYPYQKFGLYSGEILFISDAILLPSELRNAAISIQEPAYLIKATLDSESISAFGRNVALKSGMTLSADITLDDRNLIQWLFEPLLSLRGRL